MTTAVFVLARTLHIGSAMMLVALSYSMLEVLKPVFSAGAGGSYARLMGTLRRWMWVMLVLEALSGVIWFWFVAAQMSDASPWGLPDLSDLTAVLGQTQFGRLWLERLVIGIGLTGALFFAERGKAGVPRASIWNWLVLPMGSLLLVTLAWAGHAAAGIHHHALHLTADILHLVTGAIWPMGLIPLAIFLFQTPVGTPSTCEKDRVEVLLRFSRRSVWAVLVLIMSGLINSWLMLSSWSALVTTVYGELLLAKVLMVAIMIGLGAWNRIYLLSRRRNGAVTFRALRRTILAESCLAGIVLVIVGIMGMSPPPS